MPAAYPYRVAPFTGGVETRNTRHMSAAAAESAVWNALRAGQSPVHVYYHGHAICRFTTPDLARRLLDDITDATNAARAFQPVPRGQRKKEAWTLLHDALGGDGERATNLYNQLRPYLK